MTDPTIAAWSRESDLLFQLRQLREENERLRTALAQPPLPVQPVQEPWGACVSGRVFVGALPEHVRKISEDEGAPIQWLYTTPPQRKPLTHIQSKELVDKYGYDLLKLVFQTEAAHGIKEQ